MGIGDPFFAASVISSLKGNQWKSRDELEELQAERVLSLLEYARRRVPFYQKLPPADRSGGLEALASMPILRKKDIRLNPDSLISLDYRKSDMRSYFTSGTTGEPLVHYMAHRDGMHGSALRQHTFMECGFSPLDLMANLAFSRMPRFPLSPLLFRVRSITPSPDTGRNLSALAAMRPDIVYAYPSLLAIIADYSIRKGTGLSIRKAISVSEFMRPRTRQFIEESLNCRIRNYYAASECWAIAWECGHGSLHVNSDSVIVEAVDGNGHPVACGQAGRLLVTPLWRRSMPFIRYDLGDWGRLGRGCSCGRGLHVIKSLEGRTADFIIMPSGRTLPWIFVEVPINNSGRFLSYQAIQDRSGALHISIVPCVGGTQGIAESVRAAVLKALPEPLEVTVETVDSIKRGKRWKKRDFISYMEAPF